MLHAPQGPRGPELGKRRGEWRPPPQNAVTTCQAGGGARERHAPQAAGGGRSRGQLSQLRWGDQMRSTQVSASPLPDPRSTENITGVWKQLKK